MCVCVCVCVCVLRESKESTDVHWRDARGVSEAQPTDTCTKRQKGKGKRAPAGASEKLTKRRNGHTAAKADSGRQARESENALQAHSGGYNAQEAAEGAAGEVAVATAEGGGRKTRDMHCMHCTAVDVAAVPPAPSPFCFSVFFRRTRAKRRRQWISSEAQRRRRNRGGQRRGRRVAVHTVAKQRPAVDGAAATRPFSQRRGGETMRGLRNAAGAVRARTGRGEAFGAARDRESGGGQGTQRKRRGMQRSLCQAVAAAECPCVNPIGIQLEQSWNPIGDAIGILMKRLDLLFRCWNPIETLTKFQSGCLAAFTPWASSRRALRACPGPRRCLRRRTPPCSLSCVTRGCNVRVSGSSSQPG